MIEAFWDTSVLVPLCVDQPPYTKVSQALSSRYAVNVWWGTSVEIMSALTRLRRSAMTTESGFQSAKVQLSRMMNDWNVIEPSGELNALASQLLEKYSLRAGDALQLAAAIEWTEGQPQGFIFLTMDQRLAEAAESAGFALEPGLT